MVAGSQSPYVRPLVLRWTLRAELSRLKVKALKHRAREAGVSEEMLDDADDADDIKSTVVELILDANSRAASRRLDERHALAAELRELKLKALKQQRARSCGVSQDLLDDADDADDTKAPWLSWSLPQKWLNATLRANILCS